MSKRICIVGPGRMGTGIATALLACREEFEIFLLDLKKRPQEEARNTLQNARSAIESNLWLLHELEELPTAPSALLDRLALSSEPGEVWGGCDIVFEALPEKVALKQDFIRKIESFLAKNTVIASATSTISLKTFCDAARFPERILLVHWLNPAFIVPLVEISTGNQTAPSAVEKVRLLLEAAAKIPVILRDSPGYIVPRIQVAAMNEAARIIEEGVASPEEVDTAIKAGFGFRLAVMGLVEFIDLGGLDILYHASRFLHDTLGQAQYTPVKCVIEKMEKGEIGPRSGRGFYDYGQVDTERMFRRRYQGFIELLNLFRRSQILDFRGGIHD